MARFGTVGRLTTCPRCHGRNGVVWMRDAGGACQACLYCGWYGYADRRGRSKAERAGDSDREERFGREKEEAVAMSS